jgi:hypothetical protein
MPYKYYKKGFYWKITHPTIIALCVIFLIQASLHFTISTIELECKTTVSLFCTVLSIMQISAFLELFYVRLPHIKLLHHRQIFNFDCTMYHVLLFLLLVLSKKNQQCKAKILTSSKNSCLFVFLLFFSIWSQHFVLSILLARGWVSINLKLISFWEKMHKQHTLRNCMVGIYPEETIQHHGKIKYFLSCWNTVVMYNFRAKLLRKWPKIKYKC